MTLAELLTELRERVLRDVSTAVAAGADGQLWSDSALALYLRDAEEKFAAGTLCLRDASAAAVTQITLSAGQTDYTLDRRVLVVYAANQGATHLGRTSYAARFGARAELSPAMAFTAPTNTGQPLVFYTDREAHKLGVYPAPDASSAGVPLTLQVARLPLTPLSLSNLAAEPEIPAEYHLDLVEWAAWRALRNHDADIDGDANNISVVMARSSAHRKRFEDAVAECKRRFKYLNTQHVDFGVHANWS